MFGLDDDYCSADDIGGNLGGPCGCSGCVRDREERAVRSTIVDIFTSCPKCGAEHLDVGEWRDRPHRTHLCLECGELWRPSEEYTRGVPKSGSET